MATSGLEWRKAREQGIEFTLPASKYVVALRPVEVDFFIQHGSVPDLLAGVVNTLINGDSQVLDVPVTDELEKNVKWLTFLNELVTYAFVNPKVVDTPQADDEIALDDVSYADKVFIYRYIFARPAHVLQKFRLIWADAVARVDVPQDAGRTALKTAPPESMVEPPARDARHLDSALVR
jgi:hypothetical protein